ncbi:MAG TPA: SDR family oxidoreductase, partial [Roseiflexaceae bacterium]|nr:SDR family oxidoreductase [Roseiflexaceae bacterium]
IALDAVEGLRRQWAVELGQHGVRVVTLKTGGIPESISDSFEHKQAITDNITQQTLLGRAATLADVGRVAAFIASDHARTITATEINMSCGAMLD